MRTNSKLTCQSGRLVPCSLNTGLLCAALLGMGSTKDVMATAQRTNVLGHKLEACCTEPPVGYRRDGFCAAQDDDHGAHLVCAEVTDAFLQYSKGRGNDLMTPRPQMGFAGLKPGDLWCLCVNRWQEALAANVAPPIHLQRTDARALETVRLEDLKAHAIDTTQH